MIYPEPMVTISLAEYNELTKKITPKDVFLNNEGIYRGRGFHDCLCLLSLAKKDKCFKLSDIPKYITMSETTPLLHKVMGDVLS